MDSKPDLTTGMISALHDLSERIAQPVLDAGDGMNARALGRGYSEIQAKAIAARWITLCLAVVESGVDKPAAAAKDE